MSKFKEGDILETYLSSEWDEDVPRKEVAVVKKMDGKLIAKSTMTADWYELDEFNWEVKYGR